MQMLNFIKSFSSDLYCYIVFQHHIDKWKFKIPFVCGARNLGEALRRISEGAAMIRTKGEAGTGNVVNAGKYASVHEPKITTLYIYYNYLKLLDNLYIIPKSASCQNNQSRNSSGTSYG